MAAASLEDRELHDRLLRGDPTAPAELAERFLEPVARRVAGRVARAYTNDLAYDMAVDAILKLGRQPRRYDPGRGSLLTFLVLDAEGDAKNAARREDRHQFHQSPIEDVELLALQRKLYSAGPEDLLVRDDVVHLPPGVSKDEALEAIRRAFPDERDRQALQLMGARVRPTAAYARVFGLEQLGPEEQRRAVKREKDRIMVKGKRLLERMARAALQREDRHASR